MQKVESVNLDLLSEFYTQLKYFERYINFI